uniref:Protein kinase domain-containing protein n=1 Tax=Ganoderma boninense TaxID=34458 RepID=A0A5K1JRQ3_9APHY|nr:Protein kinase domain-containing protein [Ganoderma boninense]
MTIFTLSSLLGLIGAIGRKRTLVGLYASTITFTTVLSIATGIFFIYSLYHAGGEEQVRKCEQNAQNAQDPSDPNFQQTTSVDNWVCQTGFATGRTIVVVVYVIFWLIEIYGCVIAFNYVSQLDEEEQAQFSDQEKPAPQVTIVQPAYAFSERPNVYGGRA